MFEHSSVSAQREMVELKNYQKYISSKEIEAHDNKVGSENKKY